MLPHTPISYTQLPPLPSPDDDEQQLWPFDRLPAFARVHGTAQGQLSDFHRAKRKEQQLQSMLRCILALSGDEPCTVVDFGGGTGHLAIPLALLKPHFTVIVVDLHERSLELLHAKVKEHCVMTSHDNLHMLPDLCERLRQCGTIPNLYTFSGPLQDFEGHFDIGAALHLCGESTDLALRKCAKARALVFAPCCVGKLNRNVKNPYIWQSTGSNLPTVQYPQSSHVRRYVTNEDDWNALARAADYGDIQECRTTRNATRRTAKALLETDRRLYLEEELGYETALTRMEPWEATPKNDILLAWKPGSGFDLPLLPNDECESDIRKTVDYLLKCQPTGSGSIQVNVEQNDGMDWAGEEEARIRQVILNFLDSNDTQYVFPVGMGARSRKVIHHVAAQMSLAHWGQGKRSGEKTVVVARKSVHISTRANS